MIKVSSIIILTFLFTGFLNAQIIDSKKCDCDSILKAKIESQVMFAFTGRPVKVLVKPDNKTCEIGKFSIDIAVNQDGKVIQADFNAKISSEISDKLKGILIDAAMKSKFESKNDEPTPKSRQFYK